jgi:diguanylate cyclase (GGDEF)-like protein
VAPAVVGGFFTLTVVGLLAGLLGPLLAPPTPDPPGPPARPAPDPKQALAGSRPEVAPTASTPGEPETREPAAGPRLVPLSPSLLLAHDALEGQAQELSAELARTREALFLEVARRKQAEAELASLSDQDPLTGLPGRRLLNDRFSVAVAHAIRQRQKLALLLLDLDGLAETNERWGRGVGDDLIRSMGALLERSLRQGDTIARLGGDEFTVLLPGIKQDEDVAVIAEKLRLALRSPFSIGGRELTATASIGIALHPDDGPDIESLLKCAHIALGRAKGKGGDSYDIHAPRSSAVAAERLALESALRKALVQQALSLVYQPIVACETGVIVGVEALLRWRNPDQQTMAAADFVPLADATGLSVPLGQWALRNACSQAKAWLDAGHAGIVIMVNVSPRQLQHPSLVKLVKRALEETRLPPASLELEVPEVELVRSPRHSIDRLSELKALGLRISIDDFGVGDSVLSQLHRYPVDALKIDGSVIHDIATDRNREAVATAVIALARARKLTVVAEGVETEAQRVLLARWQCDRIQGNLIGPPVAAAEIETLLARQKRTALAGPQ